MANAGFTTFSAQSGVAIAQTAPQDAVEPGGRSVSQPETVVKQQK